MNLTGKNKGIITARLINDPFSDEEGNPVEHAIARYADAMLLQALERKPQHIGDIKDDILRHIHPKSHTLGENSFFDMLGRDGLYLNGAAYEMIRRVTESYTGPLDSKITILHFYRNSPYFMRSGGILGAEKVLERIEEAAENVTSAIKIRSLTKEEFERVYGSIWGAEDDIEQRIKFFEYHSKQQYIDHMHSYFDPAEFPDIESENYRFTQRMVRMLPVLFENFGKIGWDLESSRKELDKGFGSILGEKRVDAGQGNHYYFAMRLPPKNNAMKKLFPFLFRKDRSKASVEEVIRELNNRVGYDIAESNKKIRTQIDEFTSWKSAVKAYINTAISRFQDLSRVVPALEDRIEDELGLLRSYLSDIKGMEIEEWNPEEQPRLETDDDFINFATRAFSAYRPGSVLERKLSCLRQGLDDYELMSVSMLVEEFRRADDRGKFIEAVLGKLDEKDTYLGHTYRAADLYRIVGTRFKEIGLLDIGDRDLLYAMGLLHDFGKTLTPPEILNSSRRLSEGEWRIISKHPEHGGDMLHRMGYRMRILESAYCHHERWDGRGYPYGLSDTGIPAAARLMAIVDTLDAISASSIDRSRKYDQAPRTWEDAVEEINRCSGSQFDPVMVNAFNDLAEDGSIGNYYREVIEGGFFEKRPNFHVISRFRDPNSKAPPPHFTYR